MGASTYIILNPGSGAALREAIGEVVAFVVVGTVYSPVFIAEAIASEIKKADVKRAQENLRHQKQQATMGMDPQTRLVAQMSLIANNHWSFQDLRSSLQRSYDFLQRDHLSPRFQETNQIVLDFWETYLKAYQEGRLSDPNLKDSLKDWEEKFNTFMYHRNNKS